MDNTEIQSAPQILEPLWSPIKTADYLGVSRQTVYGYIRNGKIKAVKVGRAVRIPKSEIAKLVEIVKSELK